MRLAVIVHEIEHSGDEARELALMEEAGAKNAEVSASDYNAEIAIIRCEVEDLLLFRSRLDRLGSCYGQTRILKEGRGALEAVEV